MQKNFWGQKEFKYYNYSDSYNSDDKQRIQRLVNNPNHGYLKPGETLTGLKAYDYSGYETIDTGYVVKYNSFSDGKAQVSIEKK